MTTRYKASISVTPMRPSSSPITAMMKSVRLAGKKPSWLCVPSNRPLPLNPPEPSAVLDWMMFQPAPCGSRSGSNNVSTRCFW